MLLSSLSLSAASALALASAATAAVYTDPSIVSRKQYDFIVVGAGVGGATVASRLSENRAYRVLVIEAGGSVDGIEAIEVPLMMIQTSPDKYYNWYVIPLA